MLLEIDADLSIVFVLLMLWILIEYLRTFNRFFKVVSLYLGFINNHFSEELKALRFIGSLETFSKLLSVGSCLKIMSWDLFNLIKLKYLLFIIK